MVIGIHFRAHDVAKRLGTDIDKGLTSHEVRARHQKYGHNVIPNVEQTFYYPNSFAPV